MRPPLIWQACAAVIWASFITMPIMSGNYIIAATVYVLCELWLHVIGRLGARLWKKGGSPMAYGKPKPMPKPPRPPRR